MKHSFLFFVAVVFFSAGLFAQERIGGILTGVVKDDSTRRALEFVTVALLKQVDTAVVTGTVTDSKGHFEIDNVLAGEYILRYSFLGYEEKRSSRLRVDSKQNEINVGTVLLTQTTLNLGEVMVTGQRALFNNAIDRKVYNVQQDVMSKTGSASDLLQNIPSVQVDLDGTVSLRGSPNVQILINGKPSPLIGKNGAVALQQMPASSIEKIEVITNPSAKFKPDGTSGIINIVMKKDAKTGFNGAAIANGGTSSRYNLNVTANYNPGGLNIFGSYSLRQDERNSSSTDMQTRRNTASVPSYYTDNTRRFERPLTNIATFGLDYTLDKQNKLGLSGNIRARDFTREEASTKLLTDNSGRVTNDYDRRRIDYESQPESGLTAFFEHNFEDKEHNVRFEFTAAQSKESEENHYTNTYRTPASPLDFDNTLLRPTDANRQLTIDYSDPLSEHSKLEAGYDGQFNKNEMDLVVEYFDQNQKAFVKDLFKSNHFIYNETTHAMYGTYETSTGSFSVLGGLRLEEALVRSDLATRDSVISNNYFNLYPTLHLAYKLSEFTQLQLNYSRRANRPDGEELNPFPDYRDPRNIRAGNPRLLPEFIHSIELGCQLQNDNITVVPSLFYRNRYNGFTTVTKILNDSTLLTTRENLSTDQTAGLEFVVAGNVGSIFTTNMSANAFYEEIDASNLGFGNKKSTVTWSGTLNCNVNFSKATMLQINSNYRSSRLRPQGEQPPRFVMNIGFRQDLLEEKLSLVVTASDIFRTLNEKTNLNTPWLDQNVVSKRDSRIVYVGLTYHFGVPAKKSKDKPLQYDNND